MKLTTPDRQPALPRRSPIAPAGIPRTFTLSRILDSKVNLRQRECIAPRVLLHASLLASEDKALLESVFIHHTPVTLIAHAAGSQTREARRLRNRVRRLVRHVLSTRFRAVARAVMCSSLSGAHAAVARRHFLHSRTMRQTARELQLPFHAVRRIAHEVKVITGLTHTAPIRLAA